MRISKLGFVNDNLEAQAYKYAANIDNRNFGYSIEAAKKIFKNYTYLVVKALKQFQQSRKAIEDDVKAFRTMVAYNTGKIWYERLKKAKPVIEQMKKTRFEMWRAEQELLAAETNEEAVRALKKYVAGGTLRTWQKIKLLEAFEVNTAEYVKEYRDIQVARKRNNIIPAQIARLSDTNFYGSSERRKQLEEEYDETRYILDEQEIELNFELDAKLKEKWEEAEKTRGALRNVK